MKTTKVKQSFDNNWLFFVWQKFNNQINIDLSQRNWKNMKYFEYIFTVQICGVQSTHKMKLLHKQ